MNFPYVCLEFAESKRLLNTSCSLCTGKHCGMRKAPFSASSIIGLIGLVVCSSHWMRTLTLSWEHTEGRLKRSRRFNVSHCVCHSCRSRLPSLHALRGVFGFSYRKLTTVLLLLRVVLLQVIRLLMRVMHCAHWRRGLPKATRGWTKPPWAPWQTSLWRNALDGPSLRRLMLFVRPADHCF